MTTNARFESFDPVPVGVQMRAALDGLRVGGRRTSRRLLIGAIMAVALFAFEIFNFDTTRYALANLLGNVEFMHVGWATILAIAFCAIDLAGLMRIFTPTTDGKPSREAWYLMAAWLLGATMNAIMTWWAVSLTLLNHEFGNEVLSRAQLLVIVPIFVAVLVWLTRILFIGALTMTGEQLVAAYRDRPPAEAAPRPAAPADRPAAPAAAPRTEARLRAKPTPARAPSPVVPTAAPPVDSATPPNAAQPSLLRAEPASPPVATPPAPHSNTARPLRSGPPNRPQPNARNRPAEPSGGNLRPRTTPTGD